jgi:exodeoxyribonuclease VII large subunit
VEQITLDWGLERRSYTVSELTAEMRAVLARQFTDVWVAGEISGAKLPPSGHYYFTLKDEAAQIRCVCYKMTARYLKFKPQDGVAVLARGRIDLYDARGEVQLVVEALEPQGHGALQFAFEQLKRKLAAEGLFDQLRKRPLPMLPERIGLLVGLTMRAVAALSGIAGEVREAAKARGAERSPTAFAVPFLVRTLRHADELGEALAARGVDDADSATSPRRSPPR